MIIRSYVSGLDVRKYYVILFSLFIATLPFKNSLSNIVIGVLVAYLLFATLILKKKFSFKYEYLSSVKFLPILFVLFVLSLFYSTRISVGVHFVEMALPLLIVPVCFGFIRLSKNEKKFLLWGFVLANLLGVLFNLSRALFRSTQSINGALTFDSTVLGDQPFWYSIAQGGNYFFYDELSYFLHPTYWAVYLLLCLFIVLEAYQKSDTIKFKVLAALILGLLLITIFLSSSRVVVITTALLLLAYITVKTFKSKLFYWLIPGLVIVIGLSIITIAKNPRFVGFRNRNDLETFHHARLEAWRSAWKVFNHAPIFGVGIGDSEGQLFDEYLARNYQEGYLKQYNEHNQFLQIANSCGLFGLGFFLMALGNGLQVAFTKRDFILFSFIASIAVVCVVENFLMRRAGIFYFSLFYCILMMPEELKPNDK